MKCYFLKLSMMRYNQMQKVDSFIITLYLKSDFNRRGQLVLTSLN